MSLIPTTCQVAHLHSAVSEHRLWAATYRKKSVFEVVEEGVDEREEDDRDNQANCEREEVKGRSWALIRLDGIRGEHRFREKARKTYG